VFEEVTLPLWIVAVLVLLAAWAVIDRLLTPSIRWFVQRRAESALEEFNSKLRLPVKPFQLTRRRALIDRLVFDPQVVAEARKHQQEQDLSRQVVLEEVEAYAREIVPAFNAYLYFRFGYWLARGLSRSLYRVRLGSSDADAVARIAEEATVVFVMNHRSNMDYILVSHLAAEDSALSYAVGEWARIWPLEQLIRAMGAYFVRRRSRNDLYRRVLARYVQMATAQGVTQAVFPEGGLSRDGRLKAPKLGLLDYMLRSFDPQEDRDILFVPVAINYDRVLEDRSLLADLDPDVDARQGMAAFGTAVGFLLKQLGLMARQKWHRFGYACVSFGAPISTREYLEQRHLDLRALAPEIRFERVGELAETLMRAIGRLVPVLPVSLVSTVLLQNAGRRFSDLELKTEVQGLAAALERAGAMVYVPRQDREYAIEVGLRMLILRRVVARDADGLMIARAEERAILEYYANSIAHFVDALEDGWLGSATDTAVGQVS
jgi:glycerol-3-phosphate O-acyltransferase